MGHVQDLPAKGWGSTGKDFAPLYGVPPRAGKALAASRKAAAGAEGVLLATDPDREGRPFGTWCRPCASPAPATSGSPSTRSPGGR